VDPYYNHKVMKNRLSKPVCANATTCVPLRLGWIMSVPGASRTLIEARVPYARESMAGGLSRHSRVSLDWHPPAAINLGVFL
jgi:hypothetical protein